ncbi:MAG: glutaminase domain-containing protein [Christensenellales bacterium]|jgi:hypothetical protein
MAQNTLRAPATPLVTVDPYFSIWSMADRLYDDHTRHWTGTRMSLCGLMRVDGRAYRFMGRVKTDDPIVNGDHVEAMGMFPVSQRITPLSSEYTYQAAGVEITLTFTTPLILTNLDLVSRPVSYLNLEVKSADGAQHDVDLYVDAAADPCVDQADTEAVEGGVGALPGLTDLFFRAKEQKVLAQDGDNLRIQWGAFHMVVPQLVEAAQGPATMRRRFILDGQLPRGLAGDGVQVSAMVWNFSLGEDAQRFLVAFAYDDVDPVTYMGQPLPAWWRRDGASFEQMLVDAVGEYDSLMAACEEFDNTLIGWATRAGGEKYAQLAALGYRQSIAAHKLVSRDGVPYFLSKECFSNGCMGTVDVSYPSMPLFLIYAPELVKGMFLPVIEYAQTDAWPFDFAPHDVGRYPRADGQRYGLEDGKLLYQMQMPVEECGNMLLMGAAVAMRTGDASFLEPYLETLDQWADYLVAHGGDPENQLCTDDFAGHMARNANLAVKAIMGIAAYAKVLGSLGRGEQAAYYELNARKMARAWMKMAEDGDHTVLAFGQSGTWSLKYNMIWDDLMGLDLFPESLKRREVAWYRKVQNPYGVPLDSRCDYTKGDWIIWAACLVDDKESFEALVEPVWRFLNESPDRVPFCDWYGTVDRLQQCFQNRTVIGGIYMRLLQDRGLNP